MNILFPSSLVIGRIILWITFAGFVSCIGSDTYMQSYRLLRFEQIDRSIPLKS